MGIHGVENDQKFRMRLKPTFFKEQKYFIVKWSITHKCRAGWPRLYKSSTCSGLCVRFRMVDACDADAGSEEIISPWLRNPCVEKAEVFKFSLEEAYEEISRTDFSCLSLIHSISQSRGFPLNCGS